MSKKVQHKDTWVLYTGTYQVHWVNDVATQIAIQGIIVDIKTQPKKKYESKPKRVPRKK